MKLFFTDQIHNINEGYAEGKMPFTDADKVIGPDGTVYTPADVIKLVNDAISTAIELTQGTIGKYLSDLPIIYTFQVPTMGTDSEYIYINPGFVMELYHTCNRTVAGIAYVLIHEVFHNLFMHRQREEANPTKFNNHLKTNAAQDFEINWVIEHAFPENDKNISIELAARLTDEELEDTPYVRNNDGTIVTRQIFDGVTKMFGGLIDPKYANMIWEDIYDELSNDNNNQAQDQTDKTNQSGQQKTSEDFNAGYRDAWNEVIREARAQGLLESATVSDSFLRKCIALFESKGSDYDAGYSEGRKAALDTLKKIFSPSSGGSNGGGSYSMSGENNMYNPIPGLEIMKPINAPERSGQQSCSRPNPNTPVASSGARTSANRQPNQQQQQNKTDKSDPNPHWQPPTTSSPNGVERISNSPSQGNDQNNDQADNGQNNGQSGQQFGNPDNTNNTNGQNGQGEDIKNANGQNSNDANGVDDAQKAISDIEKNNAEHPEYKVTTADGNHTGKGNNISMGDHVISKQQGKDIRNNAGYGDPKKDTLANSPFNSTNMQDIRDTIKKLGAAAQSAKAFDPANRKESTANPGRGVYNNLNKITGQIETIFTPVVDWREELKNKLDEAFSKLIDIGWNKKGISRGTYQRFSDYEGDELQNIIIMIDTSGSVLGSGNYIKQVIAEILDICKTVNPKCVDLVLFCDGIYYSEKIEDEVEPDIPEILNKHSETGGTTYTECFDYIQENYCDTGESFGACVIFTDIDVYARELPKENTLEWEPGHEMDNDAKLIWFILDNKTVKDLDRTLPYGTKIEISEDAFKNSLK